MSEASFSSFLFSYENILFLKKFNLKMCQNSSIIFVQEY